MARAEEHIRELLKLSHEERSHAAKLLLDSLDEDGEDPEAEALKVAELARRAEQVRSGTAVLHDAGEARRRIMTRLRQIRGQ